MSATDEVRARRPGGGDVATDQPQPIGPYSGDKAILNIGTPSRENTRQVRGQTVPVAETRPPSRIYFEGDEMQPASQPVEYIAQIQRELAGAGLLTGKFTVGLWDKTSREAYKELLGYANSLGTTAPEALNMYAAAEQVGGPQEPGFTRGEFLPRDPVEGRQLIQAWADQVLGRTLHDDEVARAATLLRSLDEQSFDVEQDAAERQFEAQAMGAPVVEQTDTEQVDPESRLQASLEEDFAPEIEFRGAQEDAADQNDLLGSIIGTIDRVA